MKNKMSFGLCAALSLGMLACTPTVAKSPEVSDTIRKDLRQANLTDVRVSQDREKGVVILGGRVGSETDKNQAEAIARSDAPGQVVSVEIAVMPAGVEGDAMAIHSDLDDAIEKDLDAALIQARVEKGIAYQVKNGVVTLTGEVSSQARRAQVEAIAANVPNVQQVVNELQLKNLKATSTK